MHDRLVTNGPDLVKVRFRLEPDNEGYPPFESEGVWAEPIGADTYRLDNAPWFALNVAAGDTFRATTDEDGVLWAGERLEWSGNCTIRVVPLRCDQQAVLDELVPLGVEGEGAGDAAKIVALTVRPGADLRRIKDRLKEGEANGSWAFEEGCVSDEWRSL